MAPNPKPETNLDLEAGATRQLYPSMTKNPEFRKQVYAILTFQLLITSAVAASIDLVCPVAHFLAKTSGVFFAVFILAIAVFVSLFCYGNKHPVNYILMGSFTVLMGLLVGVDCAKFKGMVILESLFLTAAVLVTVTLFTFWAAWRGYKFISLQRILCKGSTALVWLAVCVIIQIFFPLGKKMMILGALGSIAYCGYIVWDTYLLIIIGRYSKPIFFAVLLYLDVLCLFCFMIDLLGGGLAGMMAVTFRQMLLGLGPFRSFGKDPRHVVLVSSLIASVCMLQSIT